MTAFFFRAFALSFSIFIRAIPAWLGLAAFFYVIYNFFQANPIILGLLFLLAIGPTTVFMIFVHIRQGLTSVGEVSPPDLGKTFKKSIKFYGFFSLLNLLVTAFTYIGFFTFAHFGFFDLESVIDGLMSGDPEQIQAAMAFFESPAVYAYFTVASLFTQFFYAALAVPLAANAASCTPKAGNIEVFWGFGSGAIRMLLLQMIATTLLIGFGLVYAFVLVTMPMFSGQSLLQLNENPDLLTTIDTAGYAMLALLLALPIFAFVWYVSFWCAGATLTYTRRRDVSQAEREVEISRAFDRPLTGDELVALRKSRQPGSFNAQTA